MRVNLRRQCWLLFGSSESRGTASQLASIRYLENCRWRRFAVGIEGAMANLQPATAEHGGKILGPMIRKAVEKLADPGLLDAPVSHFR